MRHLKRFAMKSNAILIVPSEVSVGEEDAKDLGFFQASAHNSSRLPPGNIALFRDRRQHQD
jgi:hypothetical protein